MITKTSLLQCQVCSEGTEEEALDWLRRYSPAGTTNNWQSEDYEAHPEMKPIACEDHRGRTHYMFVC